MLYGPPGLDSCLVDVDGPHWESTLDSVTRRGSAHDFLTLPTLSDCVPVAGIYRWHAEIDLAEMVKTHFVDGPLRADDVEKPSGALDAFKQAFMAWLGRVGMERRNVSYEPVLLDRATVVEMVECRCNGDESNLQSPLYLALEMVNEEVYSLAKFAPAAERVHPLLLSSVLSVLDRVSCRTGLIRTPGWFLCQFARYHWEYEESATDEEAIGWLREMYEDDEESIARRLPSVVRPQLYPDAVRQPTNVLGRRSRSSYLSERELLELQASTDGEMANVCAELASLSRLLRTAGKRHLLGEGVDGQPIYALATVVIDENALIGELLDDHYNYAHQGSEETYYSTFIPLSTRSDAIAQQYRDLALGFRMLKHVDRLLQALHSI
ncbi:PRTRC system F family protein (plasmid) [Burkholderia pseudomallei]|uniref:PRTRC system protein F n=1 Tax=Burkholderia pseudomallei TaxID=28450 RepID=UPI00052AA681|nr:PRTRC system protein F [Burkholderia pseudomallei]AIV73750.1 PRTRC system F family protein [Burkholderia pseudomallei]